MVQTTEVRYGFDPALPQNWPFRWRIFAQRQVSAGTVVVIGASSLPRFLAAYSMCHVRLKLLGAEQVTNSKSCPRNQFCDTQAGVAFLHRKLISWAICYSAFKLRNHIARVRAFGWAFITDHPDITQSGLIGFGTTITSSIRYSWVLWWVHDFQFKRANLGLPTRYSWR